MIIKKNSKKTIRKWVETFESVLNYEKVYLKKEKRWEIVLKFGHSIFECKKANLKRDEECKTSSKGLQC